MKKILIIDDHDIVRFALKSLIQAGRKSLTVDTEASLAAGLIAIERLQPDLVVCDMSLSDSKGLDTMRTVVSAQGSRPVLMLSMHDEMIYAEQALALGVKGYLMKERAQEFLLPAVDDMLEGNIWVSPQVNTYLLNRMMKRQSRQGALRQDKQISHLSRRELEVLEKIGAGKSTKEIAFDFGLSPRTVDIHRANIKKKLQLKSSAEIFAFALTRI